VWLPLQLHGAAAFRAAIAEKRRLAVEAAARLAQVPGLVLVAPPQLSLFAFHLHRPGADREQDDSDTRRLLAAVNARQRVMITGCTVDGRFLARVCVLSFRTRQERVEQGMEDIAEEAAAVLGAD
jgi:aromatic-L-amino-acid decarboxylase